MTTEKVNPNGLKPVNIKKIFTEKSPKIARWIPGFVFRYLTKITHQDFTNEIIRDYGHLEGFDFTEAMIKKFNVKIEVEGEENLPKDGKFIFASNHPLGGFDGHILMFLIGKKYGKENYRFLVNDILMKLSNMASVFIPVNKHGKQGVELAQRLDDAYKSDIQMLTFPAGLVSRRVKGQIVDLEWQKSFINKARQYERDVIPIHISGRNSNFFYNLGNFRKTLGIKANIEMLYLIDETYHQQQKTFVVKFGKPIPWETFDKSKRPLAWAKWVKEKVYKMDGVDNIPL